MTSNTGIQSLSYAVRLRVILKYLGQLMFMLSLLALVPLAVSIMTNDLNTAGRLSAVIVLVGFAGYACGRMEAPKQLQANETLAITGLAFVLGSLLMAYPLGASGLSFIDAVFESVSAMTTTGLSVAGPVEGKSTAFLFSRSWMQWVGGLGIVVLSVALLITPGLTARMLGFSEVEKSDIAGGVRANARRVTAVYLALTLAGLGILLATGMSAFDAVAHTLAGVSTGGFSTHEESIAGLGGFTVQSAVISLSVLGAVSLGLYPQIFRRGRSTLPPKQELKGLVLSGVLSTCVFGLSLWVVDGFSFPDVMRKAPIMAFSAQTTAGFADMDVSGIGGSSKIILMMSMLVGGGFGSTAGGIKILRLIILLKIARLMVQRTATPPDAVTVLRMGGRTIEHKEIQDCLMIILLFIGVCTISWTFFLVYGYDPLDSLFDVVSATGTVGLSTGVTGPSLPGTLKCVLCMDMIMGRIEFVALLVVLYPGTWFGKKGGVQ